MDIQVKKFHQVPSISSCPNVLRTHGDLNHLPCYFSSLLVGVWAAMQNSHTSLPVQHCSRFLKTQIRKTINIGDTVNKIILVNFSSYFCGRDSSASSFETASHLTGRALHAGSQISKTVFTHALSQTPDKEAQVPQKVETSTLAAAGYVSTRSTFSICSLLSVS